MSESGDRQPNDGVHAQVWADSKFGSEAVARLRTAFATSQHPMLLADDQRRWTTGNSAASDLFCIPPDEIPWRKMDEFIPLSDRQWLDEQWQAFMDTGSAEGWQRLAIPERGPLAMEFSATANVLPARHLTVFIPPDEAHAWDKTDTSIAQTPWKPVADDSDRKELTEREREVMALVASGFQTNEVALRLFLSPETVKTHVQNALVKLGAHTRAHAVAVALVTGQIAWEA
ncbi:MAG: hypothetical protein QOI31_2531 [Solirubrobacterales bacterium]|jgi:DNA-binding CsgD family transcriptional regulator|nr:hypothetical protein [Solirubrobacterales bacterium]